ncbi:MBL fold metallo-hydrolase [Mesorhizobium sp. VK23B]|uniref:MBL fold metallo-hydrolase n=1 Tax=Mesorhizobium dulcispinae TaxID=3072316 RepID=A0ABU4XHQ4_9HYPH|nr:MULTISPECIES: MBL fold metallo-hydrolase [unclassified Mesorhizobium]MDX8467831.1 MBL fold metallo-hydrolase [Mesorhizobium sp. VK23B]MDX8474169.1 MBL fold metallo-hydrolase [Mesorhizobium sp. VK23A]MDX8518795.1 MBL fold metallo-hydrolase [Mesorhizobium sp. VK23D]
MAARTRAANRYYSGPPSDHFDGTLFFNPDGRPPGRFTDLLRWQLSGGRSKWPTAFPSPYPQAKPEQRIKGKALRLTMVGHASLLIQTGGLNILTDPVWSERASPFAFAGPKRVNAPGIAFSDLPPIDLVLVSHNHYDHLDLATLKRLKESHGPRVLTPLGNDAIINRAAPGMRLSVHDWGDRLDVGAAAIHIEPTHHWSARGGRDRRMALWAGFVIEAPGGKVYFAGDTGFHGGANYRQMAEKHGGFRLAILPIGAYEPRWFMAPQHQNPEEAVQGMKLCNAAQAAGCHWGTFQLTDEPIEEPAQKLAEALAAEGILPERFRAMRPGEIWDVPQT